MTLLTIGLSGRSGSGKDAVADALRSYGFARVAFADALRVEVATAWRIGAEMLTARATKEMPLPLFAAGMCGDAAFVAWAMAKGYDLQEPRSARWVMQRWGTDFRRTQDPDYWVRQVRRWIGRRHGLGHTRTVVTDVRMDNEAALIRQLGGHLVEVLRPDTDNGMRPDTATHSSEVGRLVPDATIFNVGTLDDLRRSALGVVATLRRASEPTGAKS